MRYDFCEPIIAGRRSLSCITTSSSLLNLDKVLNLKIIPRMLGQAADGIADLLWGRGPHRSSLVLDACNGATDELDARS